MRCLDCNHDTLYGTVTNIKVVIINQKGGGLNMKGVTIPQPEIKRSWTQDKFHNDKEIRGPIQCGECGAHHVYLPGETPAFWLGVYDEVVEMGKEAFLEQSEGDRGND